MTLGLGAGGVAVAAILSPDVSIPISYTTVSGTEVSCTVVVGSTDREVVEALRSVVATADLESLSQTAYRRAYDELVAAGSPGDPRLGRLRAFHVESAVVRELWMALPGDLQPMDRAILFRSDCSGDLE